MPSLIEKYKAQQMQLAALEDRETALEKELAKLQELRKQIICEEISKADLIDEALIEVGITNHYFPNQHGSGFCSWDEVRKEVIIEGERVVVSLDLETKTLLFDGKILTPELA